MANKQKTGFIGVGLMGHGMAKNLLEAGYPLTVIANRTRERVDDLKARGASEAMSCAELAAASEVIITCMPSMPSLAQVFEGPDGLLALATPGTIIIDTTTSDPEITKRYGAIAAERDVTILDAPLIKGPKQAWEGTIGIAVAGDKTKVDAVWPMLDAMAEHITYAGALGNAHTLKILNNAMAQGIGALASEIFTVAAKKGVDLELLYDFLSHSNAHSRRLEDSGPRIMNGNHEVAFAIDTALKDVTLYTKMANEAGALHLAGDAARNLLKIASGAGYGAGNITRVATALAEIADTNLPGDD
ncbi:MAG: NAD(P)-dependent oxidoreductase [Rhodospirillales bacterium]|nr:NAD(P)-dependent oxidoreductase [Rhodospirillales bacterium]